MPVLAMWGAEGLLGTLPTEEIWRAYAPDLRVAAIPACGHFVPEEQPQAVLSQLRSFLG